MDELSALIDFDVKVNKDLRWNVVLVMIPMFADLYNVYGRKINYPIVITHMMRAPKRSVTRSTWIPS